MATYPLEIELTSNSKRLVSYDYPQYAKLVKKNAKSIKVLREEHNEVESFKLYVVIGKFAIYKKNDEMIFC